MLKKLFLVLAIILAVPSLLLARSRASQSSSEEHRPLYYTRAISNNDLSERTLRELQLMRNTIYARAGNKFRKKWLNDYFSAQPWYHPLDQIDESKLTDLDRKNAETIAQYDAGISRSLLMNMQGDLAVKNPKTPEDRVEMRLIAIRLGKWVGSDEDQPTALEDPRLLDKQLTVDQLRDFSRQSEVLRSYFEAVEWYKPDPKFTNTRLTTMDKRNINVILSVENQLGGPLTDYQNKKEDGWFARA